MKQHKHKYVAVVVIETSEKVTKKLIREYLNDLLVSIPFDHLRAGRVRSVED